MNEIERCFQVLLMDGGKLKPEAETIMRDLERFCGWHTKALPMTKHDEVDPLQITAIHAKRMVYAHIQERLAAK